MSRIFWLFIALIAFSEGQVQQTPTVNSAGNERTSVSVRTGSGLFNPSSQRPLFYRRGRFEMSISKEKGKLSLAVRKDQAGTVMLPMPIEVVQVNELRAYEETGIVIGMVNGSVYEIVLVDLATPKVVSSFYGYNPSVSPNDRFIAFTKFYPPHFVSGVSDISLLYDVANTSAPPRKTNPVEAGTVAYPPNLKNIEGNNTGVPTDQAYRFASQQYFWDHDSREFAFADIHSGMLDLVIVVVNDSQPSPRTFQVDWRDVCGTTSNGSCQVTMTNVVFGDKELTTEFRGVGPTASQSRTIRAAYRDFTLRSSSSAPKL